MTTTKTTKTTKLAAVILCSLATTATAKGTADRPELLPLFKLAGEWSSHGGVAVLGGKPAKLDIRVSCVPTPNQIGLLCNSKITIEGMGTSENTDLFGYDPGSKTYHWFCVNGMGDAHDHVAQPSRDGKTFTWVYAGPSNGKPMKEVITMVLDDTGTKLDFKNVATVAGRQAWKMTASMTKK